MHYVYAALIALATLTPWAIYAAHLRSCRRDARDARTQLALARGGLNPDRRPDPRRFFADRPPTIRHAGTGTCRDCGDTTDLGSDGRCLVTCHGPAAAPEPPAVRPYVDQPFLDVPDDVEHQRPVTGWLTIVPTGIQPGHCRACGHVPHEDVCEVEARSQIDGKSFGPCGCTFTVNP